MIEHQTLIAPLTGVAVVLGSGPGQQGRLIGEQSENVLLADSIGLLQLRPPALGERLAAVAHLLDRVHETEGFAGEVVLPSHPVADQGAGHGRQIVERLAERADASRGLVLQVPELVLELGQLAAHGGDLPYLIRDLDALIDDHLRSLDARQNRSENGVSGRDAHQNDERNQDDGGKVSDVHVMLLGGGEPARRK